MASKKQKADKLKKHPFKWVIWSIAVLFFFYEYVLRVTPSILVPELMSTFKVNAQTVGVISAFYFYAYAPMQLPVGMLTDRFGARRLLVIAAVICGIGGILFSLSHSIAVAELGRFLLGIGSAFAFIGLVYITTHWFDKSRWALLIGIGNSIGTMGAVVGEGPMSLAVDRWGFRSVMFITSLIAFGIAILIIGAVRNQPKEFHQEANSWSPSFWLSLKIVFRSKRAWVIALVSTGYYLSVVALGALWGVPFLRASNGFSQEVASFATSMIYFGFVIGGPLIGHIADKFRCKKELLITFLGLTMLTLSALIYLSPLPDGTVFLVTFLVGFFASGQLLCFPLAIEVASDFVKGTTTAFVNGITFLGGAIMQPLIGSILDVSSGGNEFSLGNFQFALSLFVVILGITFVGSFFIVDPKKRQVKAMVRNDHTIMMAEKKKAA